MLGSVQRVIRSSIRHRHKADMKPEVFHLSQYQPKSYEMASLQGFAPDLNECLINLGLRQDVIRVLDAEFTTNMGMFCTSLSIMATEKRVDSNWRFSQYGLLYIVDDRNDFEVTELDGIKLTLNHTEFSLAIAVMACRENIIGALMQGFKNPFRISLFYQNVLLHCIDSLDQANIDRSKVLKFLEKHKRSEFRGHEPYFDRYLKAEVAS